MYRKRFVALISIIALILFTLIAWEVYGVPGFWTSFDQVVNTGVGSQHPWLVAVAKALALGFSAPAMVLATILISSYLWFKRRYREAAFLGCTMLLEALITFGMKSIIHRVRPENALVIENTYAFPSGHTAVSTVFCGLLLYLAWPYLATRRRKALGVLAAGILAIFVGLSRLYLHVHWLSDVVGGLALGVFLVGTAVLIDQLVQRNPP
jgi:membrane-associated phospholipid phosphatase